MIFVNVLKSLIEGFRLCLFNREIRRLSYWPWLIATFVYPFVVYGAVSAYLPLLAWLGGSGAGWMGWLQYYGIAILLVPSLLMVSLFVSLILVLICSSVFQTSIATVVLKSKGIPVPEAGSGVNATLSEVWRTLRTESLKLLWLLPLGVLSFLFCLIPPLAPLSLLLGAWLISYQFIDIALDALRLPASRRFRFSLSHSFHLVAFGIPLVCLWAVPFLGLLLAPVACAAAAHMLSTSKLLGTLQENTMSVDTSIERR